MKIDKEQFEELCASYAIGALSKEDEHALFDALKSGSEAYEKIFSEYAGTSYLLNQSIVREVPSPKSKLILLNTIQRREKTSLFSPKIFLERLALAIGFGTPRFGLTVALLLCVVIVEISAFAYMLHDEMVTKEHHGIQMETVLTDQQTRFAAIQNELQKKNDMLEVLQSRNIAVVFMDGMKVNPSGYGKLIWDPERKVAILQIAQLPVISSDKDYQLWCLDKNKKSISAGIFSIASDQETLFKISMLTVPQQKEISAFAITLEPKGGMPQPTGEMYLFGQLKL